MSRDYAAIATLVKRAADGDQLAFGAIVEEFSSLAWSIVWTSGLSPTQGEDAVQGMWLRLVQNLGAIREPERLAGWIATTTRRECFAVLRQAGSSVAATDDDAMSERNQSVSSDPSRDIVEAERSSAVRAAFRRLDDRCQQLLQLLIAEPPIPYSEISVDLSLPVGSIGPTRARCLDRLRRDPAIVALL